MNLTSAQLNDVLLKTTGGAQTVSGGTLFVNGLSAGGQIQIYAGTTPAACLRVDPANFYILLTNNGDPQGTFNALRPFSISLTTGEVTFGQPAHHSTTLNMENSAEIRLVGANGYYGRLRGDSANLVGFINQQGNAWNFQIYDNGNYNFRGYSTLALGVTNTNVDVNGYQATVGPGYIKLNEFQNGGYIDLMQARDQDYRWRIQYNIGPDSLSFYWKAGSTITFQTNSDIYCSGFGSVWSAINSLGGKANAGAKVQWDSGVAEWGPLNGPVTTDVPAPYVMCGWHTQSNGNWVSGAQWIRGVQLRNQ
jgi:hypothetical protein